jgi:Cupin-like domain
VSSGIGPIAEWREVDTATFRDRIYLTNQPAVLRDAVRQWPAVQRGSPSAQAMCGYLLGLPQGTPVPLLTAEPSVKGRLFFREDMQGPNFQRRAVPLAAGLQALLAHLDDPLPPAVFVESALLSDCLPTFALDNSLDLLDRSVAPAGGSLADRSVANRSVAPAGDSLANRSVAPRIWIGNAIQVHTHCDFSNNIACVLAGRRRFTVFPPEQLPNLYPAPMDITLAGVPVSMVPLQNPDFERYPRFRRALAAAQTVELEAGDALFIPYGWWHHVESLLPFNVLVNYWWNDRTPASSPADCLLHGLLALGELPVAERAVWRNFFDYYVFQTNGDPLAHLAPGARGLMGAPGPERWRQMKAILLRSLGRR